LMGLDIGGTMAKLVCMEKAGPNSVGCDLLDDGEISIASTAHMDLSFVITDDENGTKENFQIDCISGSTEGFRTLLAETAISGKRRDVLRRVVASGGGAHRFAVSVREALNVELVPFQEMQSLVEGLDFIAEHGPSDEIFTIDAQGEVERVSWPLNRYPCMLVNMGSGVSILRIDGSIGGACRFTRLGGTACGGATFLGLMRMMTSAKTFREALEMARTGNAQGVNKLVGDIYGENGCSQLGLPPHLTAAYFGKLGSARGNVWSHAAEEDCAAALLMMVVQESVVLARAFSQVLELQCGQAPPVFFVGGFLANNSMAHSLIATTFKNLGMRAPFFLRHADFLGAFGCLSHSLQNRAQGPK